MCIAEADATGAFSLQDLAWWINEIGLPCYSRFKWLNAMGRAWRLQERRNARRGDDQGPPMTRLQLPQPAGDLWLQTRDILTRLGPAGNPSAVHLGGGTVLGARLHHRESTDINIIVHDVPALGALARAPGRSENLEDPGADRGPDEERRHRRMRGHQGTVPLR